MLFLVLSAIIILIFTLTLHYRQHFLFRLQKCGTVLSQPKLSSVVSASINNKCDIEKQNKSISTQMQITTNRKGTCCCKMGNVDGEDFDFFPSLFMFYIIFMIILCILIIISDILNFCNVDNNEDIIDLLFGYSLKSNHNNSLFKLHKVSLTQYTIDYTLLYGVMILSIWESLFSFYRYYSTYLSTKIEHISSFVVIKKFIMYYAILFIITYLIYIHLYSFIFPLIILLSCIFNFYCTINFSSMLVNTYNIYIQTQTNTFDQDLLHSVYFMKYVSLICCVLQSIYLSIFVITYNINTIYYLPILWSISSCICALNFARNRITLKHLHIRAKNTFRVLFVCKCYKKKRTSKTENDPKSKTKQVSDINNNQIDKKRDDNIISFDELINKQTSITTKKSKSWHNLFDNKKYPKLKLEPNFSEPFQPNINNNKKKDRSKSGRSSKTITIDKDNCSRPNSARRSKGKALELLGIQPVAHNNTTVKLRAMGLKGKSSLSKLGLNMLNKSSTHSNREYVSMENDDDVADIINDDDIQKTPSIPSTFNISRSPSLVDINDEHSNSSKKIETQNSLAIFDDDVKNNNDDLEETSEQRMPSLHLNISDNSTKLTKSQSVPKKADIDEIIKSLNMLAKHGFCTRNSINSVKLLKKYNNFAQNNNRMSDKSGLRNAPINKFKKIINSTKSSDNDQPKLQIPKSATKSNSNMARSNSLPKD